MQIEEIKNKIIPTLQKHNIMCAGVFGSTVTGQAGKGSDIDLLVEFRNQISLLEFVGIKYELEEILGSKVDLVEYEAIKPRLRQRILLEEIRIYG